MGLAALLSRIGESCLHFCCHSVANRADTVDGFHAAGANRRRRPGRCRPQPDGNTPVGVRADGGAHCSPRSRSSRHPVVRHHTTTESAALLGRDTHLDLALLAHFRASPPGAGDAGPGGDRTPLLRCGHRRGRLPRNPGLLPFAAARRVAVVARLSATRIAPTGPSRDDGALRTAATLTRRLSALLSARGCATPLSAADLHELTDHLLGPRLAPCRATVRRSCK